jgi:adenylate kinase family enzyme
VGKAKTGKTTLAHALAEKLGLVYLSFAEIISNFVEEHKNVEILQIINDLKQGRTLTD